MTALTATAPELRTIHVERDFSAYDLTDVPPHFVNLAVRCQAPSVQLNVRGLDDTLDIPVPYNGSYTVRQTVSFPNRPTIYGLPVTVNVGVPDPKAGPKTARVSTPDLSELSTSEAKQAIRDLDDSFLELVLAAEIAGKNRTGVKNFIQGRIDD